VQGNAATLAIGPPTSQGPKSLSAPATPIGDETLIEGAEVYTAVCASCHQAGGIGVAGQFPPLKDNPNVADAAYVEGVIRNGLDGPITVNGDTYDAVMPAQPSLTDADIVNVIAYIQSGFAAPSGPAPTVDTGPVAGTQLPLLADYTILVAFLIAAGVGVLVLGPGWSPPTTGVRSPGSTPASSRP
jgi:mono/diheme cytochrome c family protein